MTTACELPADFFAHLAWRQLRIDGQDRFLGGGAKSYRGLAFSYKGAPERNLCINVVLRGRGVYLDQQRRRHELGPGTLFHRFPGSVHQTTVDPDSDYAEFFLYCDGITGSGLVDSGQIITSPVLAVGLDAVMVDAYLDLLRRIRQPEAQVDSRRALLETIGFISGLYDRAHRHRVLGFWERIIEQGCSLLESNLEARYPVEQVPAKLGVSYRAFRKHFKAATGYAPVDYRIRRRLEAAQVALMTRSVTETARDLGYEDLYSFSSQFRKFIGIPPRRFQQQMQERLSFVPLARHWQPPGRTGRSDGSDSEGMGR